MKILDDIATKGHEEWGVNSFAAENPELIEKTPAPGLNAIFACSFINALVHGNPTGNRAGNRAVLRNSEKT